MSRKITRRYGMPFHGVNSTVDEQNLSLGMLSQDSSDVLISPGRVPESAKVVRRRGTKVRGSNTGLLECPIADATMVGMEGWEFRSPSLSDGYPTHAVLFADEAKRFGQVYVRDTDGPTDYNVGEEFSSTHYPTAASTVGNLKCVPLPYDGNGATGLTRLVFDENRRRHVAGTRKHVSIGNHEYFPSYLGTPSRWNRRYNRSSASGSEKVRVFPAGHCPPLFPPSFPSASYPTRKTTAAPWAEGDTFFASCMFEWEDGSFSMPFLPRDKNTTLTSGLGLVTVDDDADGTAEYFDFIPWRNIPVGPTGVTKVWLLRTPKISKGSIASGSWPNIADLRVTGYVPNGVTSYDDPNGNDASLVADSARVNFEHKWPDRGRYEWSFDQRVGIGYLRSNPCAIIVAPTGANASRDLNASDDQNPGTYFFTVRVTTTNVVIRKTVGGVTTEIATATSGITLQQLVDTINATAFGGAAGEWAAALVPGVAPSTPASSLAYTTQDISCTKNSTTAITTAATFAEVAEGMRVSGTGIPAGTYVKTKVSNTSITLSAAATDALTSTLTFYTDTGDDSVVASGATGNVRAYCPAYFAVLPFKQSYLDTFEDAPQDFIVSPGGPTHAASAANSFKLSVGTRRSIPAEGGVFVGAAALKDGCVVFGANRIYLYRNQRSGGSGEDADYRLVELEMGRGCISFKSIVQGNGWVGCLTQDGFWVYDGERSGIMSGDMLDLRADGRYVGLWADPVETCADSSKKDGADFPFAASFVDGRLWVSTGIHRGIYCLDCSPSVESNGIAQLLRQDGSTYGWSAVCRYSWRGDTGGLADPSVGVIFAVRNATGQHLYCTDDKNDKTTCGLIQEFEVAGDYTDGSDAVPWGIYMARDLCETLSLKHLHELRVYYRFESDPSDVSLSVLIYPRPMSAPESMVIRPSSTTYRYGRKYLRPNAAARKVAETMQFAIYSGPPNASAGIFELHGVEADLMVLDSKD